MSDQDTIRKRMATKLKEAREYLGLSQDEVATYLGLSRPAVTNIENGQRKVEAIELNALANLYGRSVEYFLSTEEIQPDENLSFLARTTKGLSSNDLGELAKFAEFLRHKGKRGDGK